MLDSHSLRLAHRTFEEGYGIIVSKLDNPPTDDLKNFLGYCEAWAHSIIHHHDTEVRVILSYVMNVLLMRRLTSGSYAFPRPEHKDGFLSREGAACRRTHVLGRLPCHSPSGSGRYVQIRRRQTQEHAGVIEGCHSQSFSLTCAAKRYLTQWWRVVYTFRGGSRAY